MCPCAMQHGGFAFSDFLIMYQSDMSTTLSEVIMSNLPFDFEFDLKVGEKEHTYRTFAHTSDAGRVDRISLWQVGQDSGHSTSIDIGIDPQAYRQVAMPNKEVLSRIAISQWLEQISANAQAESDSNLLDFAVEPWGGQARTAH